jgi:hypothetical protein
MTAVALPPTIMAVASRSENDNSSPKNVFAKYTLMTIVSDEVGANSDKGARESPTKSQVILPTYRGTIRKYNQGIFFMSSGLLISLSITFAPEAQKAPRQPNNTPTAQGQRTTNNKQQTTNNKQRTTNNKQRTTNKKKSNLTCGMNG